VLSRQLLWMKEVLTFQKRGKESPSISSIMSLILVAGLVAAGAAVFAGRRVLTPRCPRCRSREWDRRLCAPLLFCRRCASRIDHTGRLCN
jgi:hypothetical protein